MPGQLNAESGHECLDLSWTWGEVEGDLLILKDYKEGPDASMCGRGLQGFLPSRAEALVGKEGEGDPTALEFEVHALFPFHTARQEQGCGVEEGIPVWTRRVEAWTKQGGQPIQP